MKSAIFITWLGQSSFILEYKNKRLLIDPFLSDVVEEYQGLKRLLPPPFSVEKLKPDVVFITHDHLDHLDPISLPEIHRQYPEIIIAGPKSVKKKSLQLGILDSQILEVSPDKTYSFGPFNLTISLAEHSDPYAVGAIIGIGEKEIYLSGDTLYSQNLVEQIRSISTCEIDLLLVCINGKLGNMNWSEAVELAKELNVTHAVPTHYGMFAENTANPTPFLESCRNFGIHAFELVHGEKTRLNI